MNDESIHPDRMADASRALVEQRTPPPPRPATPRTPLVAGATPKALVPVDFDGAWRIANTVHLAGMAPKSLNSAEKCMVAILHGLEVGLTPMNALQSIAVINGRPQIWGDGAVGLIRASGLLEYMHESYVDEDGPNMKAVCVVKRKGEPKPIATDFSMADAKKAGLLGKEGPWQTYPKRMLKMRARWALRDTFADVLKGLGLAEEAEDLARQEARDASGEPQEKPNVPPPPDDPPAQEAKPAAVVVEQKQDPISSGTEDFPGGKKPALALPNAEQDEIPLSLDRRLSENDKDWLLAISEAFSQCQTIEEISSEQDSIMAPSQDSVSPVAWKRAEAIMDKNIQRIQEQN